MEPKRKKSFASHTPIMLSDRIYNVEAIINDMSKVKDICLKKNSRNNSKGTLAKSNTNWNPKGKKS